MVVPALAADVTIVNKNNGVLQTIYLTEYLMCMVSPDGIVTFDAKAERVRMADPATKTKQEMIKADLERYAAMSKQGAGGYADAMGKNSDMMKQMREQALQSIQHLEGKEREMAEAEINKRLGMAMGSSEPKTYRPMKSEKREE